MKGAVKGYLITFLAIIIIPYIMTMCINGRCKSSSEELNRISTGRDVIMYSDGKNYLIDVEQYIAGVLPGMVDPDCDDEMLEAQAVAVRTRIYYAMGENTVIDSKSLDYTYHTEEEYMNIMGSGNYKKCIGRFNEAVINTVGKTIK
ncbi:MAG: SpoIID/LytB domain-containing protein [Wujia sp.]